MLTEQGNALIVKAKAATDAFNAAVAARDNKKFVEAAKEVLCCDMAIHQYCLSHPTPADYKEVTDALEVIINQQAVA